jgi:hypothetical protein
MIRLKTIWKYKWEILLVVLCIGSITQSVVTKDYHFLADNILFTVLAVTDFLQSKAIKNQNELIKVKNDTIKLQDELIVKQSNWIKKVEKLMKEN